MTAVIEEVQESRSVTQAKLQELSTDLKAKFDELRQTDKAKSLELQDSLLKQKSAIITKLDPLDYQGDQHKASMQRHTMSSGYWFLEDQRFKNWVHGDMLHSTVLYLNGIPGSGWRTFL